MTPRRSESQQMNTRRRRCVLCLLRLQSLWRWQVWREELRAAEECGSAGSETRHEAWRRLMFHGYKVLCLPGYEWTKHSDLKSTFTQTLSLLDENRSRPVCCNSNSWTEQQSRVITETTCPEYQESIKNQKIRSFGPSYWSLCSLLIQQTDEL